MSGDYPWATNDQQYRFPAAVNRIGEDPARYICAELVERIHIRGVSSVDVLGEWERVAGELGAQATLQAISVHRAALAHNATSDAPTDAGAVDADSPFIDDSGVETTSDVDQATITAAQVRAIAPACSVAQLRALRASAHKSDRVDVDVIAALEAILPEAVAPEVAPV